MSVFVSTSCLRGGRDALTVIRKFVDAGIRHIEIGSAHASTSGLNEILTLPGLHLAAHGPFTGRLAPRGASLFSSDPDIRDAVVTQIEEALRLCAAFGAAFYTFHPLGPSEGAPDWDAGVQALKRIAAVASGLNIVAGLENVHYGLSGSPGIAGQAARLKDLIDSVASERMRALIDLGHLKLAAAQGETDPVKFIQEMGPLAIAVHVHDNDGVTDGHLPVEKDSEVLSWLQRPELGGLPVIVETTRQTIEGILEQVRFVEAVIGK